MLRTVKYMILSTTLADMRRGTLPRAFFVIGVIFLALSQGCAPVVSRNPLPQNLVDSAEIQGIFQARIWGDELPPHYQ